MPLSARRAPGHDTVDARGGNDFISNGGGHDTIDAGAGSDTVVVGEGSSGTVHLGSNAAAGDFDNDIFASASSASTLTADYDVTAGNDGADYYVLGADGTYVFHLSEKLDKFLTAGTGSTIIGSPRGVAGLSFFGITETNAAGDDRRKITVDYLTHSTAVTVDLSTGEGSNPNAAFKDSLGLLSADRSLVDDVYGSTFGDTITGDSTANVLQGDEGEDTLTGRGGADRLVGGDDGDTLDGGDGEDELEGEGGGDKDVVTYAASATAAVVSLKTGKATGGLGTDTLLNIEGIIGSDKDDTLTGFTGNDTIVGGGGKDTLKGEAGGAGNDTINGGAGDDAMFGDSILKLTNGQVIAAAAGQRQVQWRLGKQRFRELYRVAEGGQRLAAGWQGDR